MKTEEKWQTVAVIIMIITVLFFGHMISKYQCSAKAAKMDVYQWDHGFFEGCMAKDTPESKWRDVQK